MHAALRAWVQLVSLVSTGSLGWGPTANVRGYGGVQGAEETRTKIYPLNLTYVQIPCTRPGNLDRDPALTTLMTYIRSSEQIAKIGQKINKLSNDDDGSDRQIVAMVHGPLPSRQ